MMRNNPFPGNTPGMPSFDPHTRLYDTDVAFSIADRCAQIRHLAMIGLAANVSIYNVRGMEDARISLFEVIHRLSDELGDEIEKLEGRA